MMEIEQAEQGFFEKDGRKFIKWNGKVYEYIEGFNHGAKIEIVESPYNFVGKTEKFRCNIDPNNDGIVITFDDDTELGSSEDDKELRKAIIQHLVNPHLYTYV